jgi:hypothetical protein
MNQDVTELADGLRNRCSATELLRPTGETAPNDIEKQLTPHTLSTPDDARETPSSETPALRPLNAREVSIVDFLAADEAAKKAPKPRRRGYKILHRQIITKQRMRSAVHDLGEKEWFSVYRWVYFAADPIRGLIKIGSTFDPEKRIKELQVNHGPVGLIVAAPGSIDIEHLLHWSFRHSCVSGEWFQPTKRLVGLVNVLASIVPPKRRAFAIAEFFGIKSKARARDGLRRRVERAIDAAVVAP